MISRQDLRGTGASAPRFLFAVFVAVAAVVVFYAPLLFGGWLDRLDWQMMWHYYDWIRISLTRYHTLPLYIDDAYYSRNFLANPQSPLLGPLVWLLAIVPTDGYIKLLIVLYGSAGLLGMYGLLRDLDVDTPVAAVIAVIFAFNGFFVSHVSVGHSMVLGSYLLPGLLLFYRRAALGQPVYLLLAMAINVCSIFEGYNHPFVWNNAFLALYALAWAIEARSLFPVRTWILLVALSAALGAVKLLPMSAEFGAFAALRQLPAFPPLSLLWSLVVPGQDRLTIGNETFGKWEYDFYVGGVTLLLLLVGAATGARRAWTWLAAAAVFLVMSIDFEPRTPTAEPWSIIKDLPVLKSQRCPSRFFIVALTALLIVGGVGLQSLWERARVRWRRPRLARVAAGIAIVAIYADLLLAAVPWEREAVGAALPPRNSISALLAVSQGTIKLRDFSPNRMVYEVDTPGGRIDQLLRFRDAHWYPVLDDANLAPGKQEIVVAYTPPLFRLGLLISAVTVIALVSGVGYVSVRGHASTGPYRAMES
jgi:hypothetical protein